MFFPRFFFLQVFLPGSFFVGLSPAVLFFYSGLFFHGALFSFYMGLFFRGSLSTRVFFYAGLFFTRVFFYLGLFNADLLYAGLSSSFFPFVFRLLSTLSVRGEKLTRTVLDDTLVRSLICSLVHLHCSPRTACCASALPCLLPSLTCSLPYWLLTWEEGNFMTRKCRFKPVCTPAQ